MPEELKIKLLRAFDEGWNKGNTDALFELCDIGLVHHRPPLPVIECLEAEKQDIESTFKAFSDIVFTIQELVTEGSTAVMRWTWRAKHTGQEPDLHTPLTRNQVIMEGCSVFHLVNGKIIEEWEFADYLGFFTQPGPFAGEPSVTSRQSALLPAPAPHVPRRCPMRS